MSVKGQEESNYFVQGWKWRRTVKKNAEKQNEIVPGWVDFSILFRKIVLQRFHRLCSISLFPWRPINCYFIKFLGARCSGPLPSVCRGVMQGQASLLALAHSCDHAARGVCRGYSLCETCTPERSGGWLSVFPSCASGYCVPLLCIRILGEWLCLIKP